MSLEIVNTAVEAVVDLVTEERKPLAKLAKDAAAGAVLLAAIMGSDRRADPVSPGGTGIFVYGP